MPPQSSFNIKQNTPEADKLERRLHEQLKEIWDPAADATVARYLTAMLAKGYDRKKIHSQLKAILQEAVTVQLLDWLYKHLRLHGNEYQSKEAPASSKPAPKPPPSVTKVVPTEEDELRLEDLEAQQLEDSDLEDDVEANDVGAPPASRAVESAGAASRSDAAEPQRQERQIDLQPGPAQTSGLGAQQASRTGNPSGAVTQPGGKSERTERRHREPIPIPVFSDVPRSGGSAPTATQPIPPRSGAAPTTAPQAAKAPEQARIQTDKRLQFPPQQQHEHEVPQQQQSPAGERRGRLKSSVVLDWESWQKQKQPNDEQRGAKSSVPQGREDRAPILLRGGQDGAEQTLPPPASQRERGDGRERDRERERDRSGGSGRRRQADEAEADRPGPRHRDREADDAARRGQERDSDGVGRRRGGEAANRSRSRSRSRSPRGRRPGRAPLGTANLLRNALRDVDSLGGAGARGSKPSVFERLSSGGASAAADAAPARISALQRLAGADKPDKPTDASGSGRKRGAEDNGDADTAILGSPPKASRAVQAQKPGLGDAGQGRPSGTRDGPVAGRQRIEFTQGGAPAGATRQQQPVHQKRASDSGPASSGPTAGDVGQAGKRQAAGREGTSGAETSADPKAAELDLLRKQMAAMQEKLARMEAARELSPQPAPQPASQPALQLAPQPPPQPAVKPSPQPMPAVLQPQVQPQTRPAGQPQLQVSLPSNAQQQMPGQLQPQVRPQPQALVPQPRQPPLQLPRQQQPVEMQQSSIASRLQPAHVTTAPAPGGLGARLVGGPAVAKGAGVAGGGPSGPTTIMPTSMSGVVIEGGSGSPPRRPAAQSQQQQQQQPQQQQPKPAPAAAKADQQRLAAEQLDADLRSVVVENVHPLANEDVLAAHFSVVGPVKNVTVLQDTFTGQPTGVAVVEMANEQATQAAAALSGSLLMDVPIGVTLKAALLLQGINLAAMGMNPSGLAPQPLMPPIAPGGRLNPAAAPFVPGAGLGQPLLGALGPATRPPLGAEVSGRQPWPKMGAGGRGRGSNVWVRGATRTGGAVGSNAGERN